MGDFYNFKVRLILLVLLASFFNVLSQEYPISGSDQTVCSGVFVDSGGSTGDYGINENHNFTLTSATGGNLVVDFTSFLVENNLDCFFDRLEIYNGNTAVAANLIGIYCGGSPPGTIISSGAQLHFVFASDNLFSSGGWEATISCLSEEPILHEIPNCGGTVYELNWDTSSPNGVNEFDWTPDGALTNTFTNVDGSGVNITHTFSGETGSLEEWNFAGGPDTPDVATDASGSTTNEVLQFFTTGFTAGGNITQTISFSSNVYSFGFDLYHINGLGANGDSFTITALDGDGNTIFPTFTNSATPSYTSDNSTGIVNATGGSTTGDNDQVGVNFQDVDGIASITIVWEDCTTCSSGNVHGSGIGSFDFCTDFIPEANNDVATVLEDNTIDIAVVSNDDFGGDGPSSTDITITSG
ncbi:CUB domain-containing protein, partial [Tenacibaculum amylolyticum]|uniref:CUB domain-containing protein n=1 Tax=Tenacibaculum amylolyticum TaxID=104269 RepID=UPI0038B58C8C